MCCGAPSGHARVIVITARDPLTFEASPMCVCGEEHDWKDDGTPDLPATTPPERGV